MKMGVIIRYTFYLITPLLLVVLKYFNISGVEGRPPV